MANLKVAQNEQAKQIIEVLTERRRAAVMEKIIDLSKIVYAGDLGVLNIIQHRVKTLIYVPSCVEAADFYSGVWGFICWAEEQKVPELDVLTTLLHDVSEYINNRFESWFLPRTANYSKYVLPC